MAQEIREAQEYIDYVVYALYERAVIKREESNNTYAYCIDVNMLKAEKTLIAKQLIIYVNLFIRKFVTFICTFNG